MGTSHLPATVCQVSVPWVGHTLNLAVQAALKVPRLSTILARCQKTVLHSKKSRVDREELVAKQDLLKLPNHSLIQEVSTRWNSTHNMILRLCEQQPAISAVLHRRRDLVHLECSPEDWRILEDVGDVLEPFKVATEYLSGEKYPTIFAVGPLLSEIKTKIEFNESDSPTVREVKKVLATDMSSRYQDEDVIQVLNIASFLDPRFKTLAYLPHSTQDQTVEKLKEIMLEETPDPSAYTTTKATVVQGQESSQEMQDYPAAKRIKQHPLEKLLGSKFQDRPTGSSSPSRSETITSEIGHYKVEMPTELSAKPLRWWND